MAPSFVETRLNLGMPVQAGGPKYRTKIIRTGYEFEKRWSQLSEWLYEGDLSEILLDQDQVRYLITFLNARQGREQGFRLRFWADYTATHEPKPLGHQCSTQGVMAPLVGDGNRRAFKLLKQYKQGAHLTYKVIHKPDEVQVYLDGVFVAAAVDHTTGLVTFPFPPGNNVRPTWEGTFDLPVRFDTDTIPAIQQYVESPSDDNFYETERALFQVDSLPLIEIELPVGAQGLAPILIPTPRLAPECEHRLEIGPFEGPTDAIGPSHNNFIKRLDSGFERRNTYQPEPLLKGEINQSYLADDDLEYALCFFHCRRGKAQSFRLKYWADYKVGIDDILISPYTSVQGAFTPEPDGKIKTFRFQKRYYQFGRNAYKGVVNLIPETVLVYVNDTLTSVNIDAKKGLATFATAPPSSAVLRWAGEHDLEVRFDSDQAMLKSAVLNPNNTECNADTISYQFQNMAVVEVMPTYPVKYVGDDPIYDGADLVGTVCKRPERCTGEDILPYTYEIIATGQELRMLVTLAEPKTLNKLHIYPTLNTANGLYVPNYVDIWPGENSTGTPALTRPLATYYTAIDTSDIDAFAPKRRKFLFRFRESPTPIEEWYQLSWMVLYGC